MTHHLAGQMEETPAHGGDLVTQRAGSQGGMLEQNEQIVRDDPDTEEGGIGFEANGMVAPPRNGIKVPKWR